MWVAGILMGIGLIIIIAMLLDQSTGFEVGIVIGIVILIIGFARYLAKQNSDGENPN
jgi:hypothetical protein